MYPSMADSQATISSTIAAGVIGADEAPAMASKDAMFGSLVESFEVRVIQADDLLTEHRGEGGRAHGVDEVAGASPIRLVGGQLG